MADMGIEPVVQIAGLRGGYVIVTEEYDPLTETWTTAKRVCSSIAEVVTHAIHTLEAVDAHPDREYRRIEQAAS